MELGAEVDGTSLGLPASVGVATEYSTKTDFDAVLICDSDVITEDYDVQKPFERWIWENRLVLSRVNELQDHGIVCST